MKRLVLLTLLAAYGAAQQRPAAPTTQISSGRCSPNVADVQGNVTINFHGAACVGIDPIAVDKLNEFLAQFPKAQKRLLELLDTKDKELRQSVEQAEEWSRKYRELSQRLEEQGADDEMSRQAAKLLEAGELEKAGRLLDEILARNETSVDRAARNHYDRARAWELVFKPQEALPHYERAYRYRPDSWEYALGFARLLHKQNQYDKAEGAYEGALQQLRGLAQTNRATYLPHVATTFGNLASIYQATNRVSEAERAYKEAVGIRRELVESNGGTSLPLLAMALHKLGDFYRVTNRAAEAQRTYGEALWSYLDLARGRRAAFLPLVARMLGTLGDLYRATGWPEDTRRAFSKPPDLRFELTRARPHVGHIARPANFVYLPYIVRALNHLGSVYRVTNRLAEAERAYAKALGICRELEEVNRFEYLPDVATTLHNQGTLYSVSDRKAQAERKFEEALGLRRELARRKRAVRRADVATTLISLGALYRDTNRMEEAERAFEEALGIHREVWAANRSSHGDGLAQSLIDVVIARGASSDTACPMLREAHQVAVTEPIRRMAASETKKLCPP